MANPTRPVLLIGPPNSGKTSLLASLGAGLTRTGHGYPDLGLRLKRSLGGAGDHEDLSVRFETFAKVPPTAAPVAYDLTLEWDAPKRRGVRSQVVTIVDTPGDALMPGGEPRTLVELAEQTKAEAIVLVLPLDSAIPASWDPGRLDPPPWADGLKDLAAGLFERPEVKRLSIVFSKYEKRFLYFQRAAFACACDEAAMVAILEEARDLPWLDWLDDAPSPHALDALTPPPAGLVRSFFRLATAGIGLAPSTRNGARRDVGVFLASSYGFLRDFGTPNLEVGAHGPDEDRPVQPDPDHGGNGLWRPFCSADPFVFAALGERSQMMLRLGFAAPERTEIVAARAEAFREVLASRAPRKVRAFVDLFRREWDQR